MSLTLRKFALLLVTVSLLGASSTACGGDGEDETSGAPDAGVLKIAFLGGLSGPAAVFGTSGLHTYEVFADRYNSEGGILVGDRRYRVEIVPYDSKFDPTVSRQLATKIIFDDEIRLIASAGDPQDAAIAELTEREEVIMMDSTANKELLAPPYKYIFNTFQSPNVVAVPFLSEIKKLHPNIQTIYFIGFDLGFDRKNSDWIKEAATSIGFDWRGAVYFPEATVDFSSIVTPIVRANPDMVILGSTGAASAEILTSLRQLGYRGVLGSPVVAQGLADIAEAAGEFANDYYQAEMVTYPETTALREFQADYRKFSGGSWDTLASTYWIHAAALFAGIEKAGTIDDANAIASALETLTLENPLLEGPARGQMAGEKTYGQAREMAMPIGINQDVDGEFVTRAVVEVEIP